MDGRGLVFAYQVPSLLNDKSRREDIAIRMLLSEERIRTRTVSWILLISTVENF